MAQTVVYLIRHGEVDNPEEVVYGRTIDVRLNDIGREQMRVIAKKIKDQEKQVDAIYTSPQNRAIESARIFASVFNDLPISIEEDLAEIDIPGLVGHQISELSKLYAKGIDEYSDTFVKMGNESREQITERMLRAYEKIKKSNIGKTAVAISHGDPLRFLFFRFENPNRPLPLMGELKKSYYPNKGEGWKTVIGDGGEIIALELVKREEEKTI